MKSYRTVFCGRQHMIRSDYELQHLRDIAPKAMEDHKHNNYEILFINAGANMEFSLGGRRFKVVPNDIILVNSRVTHHPILKQDSVYDRILLWLTPEYVRSISKGGISLWHCFEDPLRKNRHVLHLKKNALDPVKGALLKFEQSYFGNSYGNEMLTPLYLAELLVMLNRIYLDVEEDVVEDEIAVNKTIEGVLGYISENLSGDLTLDHLSERFFINKYHLLREFKKHVGYTIYQYIQLQRLRKAEDLIYESESSLSDVCYLCGFGDYSSFFRVFTSHYGLTPGQYAKKARSAGV